MKNKIMKEAIGRIVFSAFFTITFNFASAQSLAVSSYGLPFINSISLYKKSLVGHPEKEMISIVQIPGLVLDLRYATTNNFMHKKLYAGNVHTTFLRKPVYDALDSVCDYLATLGFGLIVFDAYRPYSVTESLWKQEKDERYTANPAKGSGHNRGISIDLSLEDLRTHKLVEMPTGFDNFSDSAHLDFKGTDTRLIINRDLLVESMKKYGFVPLSTEWWHFSWPHQENFEVLDLSFEQLEKLSRAE
jgi:D-alanyl-D-alanine dipeptidase